MRAKKRLKFWQFLLITLGSAVVLILLTFLALSLSGFRYATYNTSELGQVRFIGRVDRGGEILSGKFYYSDALNAKVVSYNEKLTFKNGGTVSSGRLYKLEYSNGDTYIGQLEGCLRHGEGRIAFSGGDIYEGSFSYDEIEGKGFYYFLSGDIYEGSFSRGKKWGEGKYTWAPDSAGRSDIYEGQYAEDMRNGTGRYTWADGSVYEGSYVDDAKQGQGKMTFATGDTYEGQYLEDMRTGKGVYKWADGESYEGDFLKGEITGQGTYYWTSGSNRLSYEGFFEKGKIVFVEEDTEAEAPEGSGADEKTET